MWSARVRGRGDHGVKDVGKALVCRLFSLFFVFGVSVPRTDFAAVVSRSVLGYI